jgi:hypothetical protein
MSEYNEISPIVSFSCFHSFDLEWPRPMLKNVLLAYSIPYRNKLEYHFLAHVLFAGKTCSLPDGASLKGQAPNIARK